MKKLKGICVPMITPMFEDGSVDYCSLEKLVDHLIERGVDALYPCGTTGEVNNLTLEERIKITEVTVKASKGRVPVFAQVGGRITKETMELARFAVEAGADGLGLLTPTYYRLSDDELYGYYTEVAKSVPETSVYMYGIPSCAVNELSASLVERIAEACPNVLGIKYSVGDIGKLSEFARIRAGKFDVLVAPVHLLLSALAVGVAGCVSGNNHIFIEAISELMKTFEAGDLASCRVLQARIANLSAKLAEKEIAKCKALLKRGGVISCDAVRLPCTQLSDTEKEELFHDMDELYPEYIFR